MSSYPAEIDQWVSDVTATCREFDNHQIATDVCSKCEECQSQFGLSEAELAKGIEDEEINDEGGFTWCACDCCHLLIGGMKYSAHAFQNGELVHLEICEDCMCYLASGYEPKAVG